MQGDAVCLESVVVAVADGATCSGIDEVAPKISSRLESMSHPSISNAVDDKKEPNSKDDEGGSVALPIAGDHIKNSRNKLLNPSDDDEAVTAAGVDGDEDTAANAGCYNQSFSKSESAASVKIDVNDANENIFNDASSLASSSARHSSAKPNEPDAAKHL